MQPYLETARRYALVIGLVLALTWGAGGVLAYVEYTTSFEADATIWTDRQSQQFASISSQDPGFSSLISPAAQQAGVLSQLLLTRNFLQQVVERASISRPAGSDERAFLDDVSKHFRIDVLGTNLFRLSYRARDPRTGYRVVIAALAERQQRLDETRSATTSAAAVFYRSELSTAQNRVLDAQRELDAFDASHKPPLATGDDYQQRQLRFAVEDARSRVADLKTRLDSSAGLPGILQLVDSLDFQVLDTPLEEGKPSGGLKPAAVIAGSAAVGGLALVAILVITGTLMAAGAAGKSAAAARKAGKVDVRTAGMSATSPNVALGASIVRSSTEPARVATRANPPGT